FTHQGDTIFATWFTYDTDGSPLWLAATAPKTGAGVYSGTLYRTTGPSFNAVPFLPANVVATAVGQPKLTFADGNNATFAYTVNGVQQAKQITRQVFRSPGTICQYAEGVWAGTTSLGETVSAIVLEGGDYYILYSKPGSAFGNGVIRGTGRMDGGNFSSSEGVDFPIAQSDETADFSTPVSLTGSYTPHSNLHLNLTGTTNRSL